MSDLSNLRKKVAFRPDETADGHVSNVSVKATFSPDPTADADVSNVSSKVAYTMEDPDGLLSSLKTQVAFLTEPEVLLSGHRIQVAFLADNTVTVSVGEVSGEGHVPDVVVNPVLPDSIAGSGMVNNPAVAISETLIVDPAIGTGNVGEARLQETVLYGDSVVGVGSVPDHPISDVNIAYIVHEITVSDMLSGIHYWGVSPGLPAQGTASETDRDAYTRRRHRYKNQQSRQVNRPSPSQSNVSE